MKSLERIAETGIKLKRIPRRGWVLRGVGDPESVAEHSFSLALMALVLAEERGMDACRAAAIALIHDLPESVIGDITPRERELMGEARYREVEEAGLREILSGLQPSSADLLLRLFQEYRESRTPEAALVKQLDRLEMAIQAASYASAGLLSPQDAGEFIASARREMVDEELGEVAEELAATLGENTR